MTSSEVQSGISRIKEVAWGLVSTAALVTAVDLGIADALASGARSAAELADELDVDPVALAQVLDALVAREVFDRNDGAYGNNDLSHLLRPSDPNSVSELVRWIGHPIFWRLWPHLLGAVREGKAQSTAVLGGDFFHYIHTQDPAAVSVFTAAMTQASNHTSAAVVRALGLTGTETVADIGGGQGRLLRTILEAHPAVRGYLLDLAGVVAQALPELRAGGALADRATVLAGDCRDDIPVEADVYVLKNILEWDDESTRATLANVRRNARPGARVLVVETLTDRTPEPVVTSALDLLLLLNVGGRKHTSHHVAELFDQVGLMFVEVRSTGTFLALVEGAVPEGGR